MKARYALRNVLMLGSLLAVLLATGCASGPTIRSNLDPAADFNKFRTFGFFQPLSTDREEYQSLISQQLVASTKRELEARGLQFTDTNPDLLINFSANLDQRLRVTQTPSMSSRSPHPSWRGGYRTWPTHQQIDVRQYTLGTIVIDAVDASQRQLVWEGLATSRVTQRTMDDIGPVLNSAVVDIMRDFPLPPR
ncbi:MAG: DUF4136 domain-containing protein [Haliea sp.]|nr:DUF4136 domain-containing protein [Haliea sp.]